MPSNEPKNELTTSEEVSMKSERSSETQTADHPENSVYDFLYHDVRRIGSFLSQFQTHGIAQNIRTTETIASVGNSKAGFEASGGLPLVAQIKGGADVASTDEQRESTEQTFDPLWTNAKKLLDYLQSNDLISRSLPSAGIGHFVLVSGALSILDFSIMKKILGTKLLKDSLLSGNLGGDPSKSSGSHKERQEIKSQMNIGFELLGQFPMAIQATLQAGEKSVWCSLNEEFCSIQPGDLLLRHGPHLPGEWNLLGILDAIPENAIETILNSEKRFGGSDMAAGLAYMANMIRPILGRPASSFGLTPIMIFRSISG